jgi:CubicO group peptidase (beta-lactamase class C family)
MPVARLILALLAIVGSFGAHAGEFPGAEWDVASRDAELEAHIDTAFAPDAGPVLSGVRALLLVQDGRIRAERYREGFGPESKFISWSMGKSMVQALAGVMVREGRITPTSPLPVPEWQQDPADPRRAITLDDALRMSTGLAFNEDYSDLQNSDAIRMLFGDGARDMGAYAATRPLIHPPGTFWDYSSGTTNIVSRVIRDLSGGTEKSYRGFVQRELLAPIGIRNAVLEFDAAGTLIGSSLIFMKARDYARFGLLYLHDGVWNGQRILPEGWVERARRPTAGSKGRYGAQWWLSFSDPEGVPTAKRQFPSDTFMARGHQEQAIIVIPSKRAVLVCLSLIESGDVSELQDWLVGVVEGS